MAGKPAEEQKHTVGCEYLPNNRKVVALKKSYGCESLYSEKTALTPLSTLTTAQYGAVTRMNSAFAGAATSKPERLSAHDTKNCHAEADCEQNDHFAEGESVQRTRLLQNGQDRAKRRREGGGVADPFNASNQALVSASQTKFDTS